MDMAEILSLWWVYPAAVCIATLAISTGISGGLFFAPFFLLVVGLPPAQAIGGGLMTMIAGTGSGAFSYNRQGVVDFTIVRSLLLVTVPFAMGGAVVALIVDADALRAALGAGLIALAGFLLWTNLRRSTSRRSREGGNPDATDKATAPSDPVEGSSAAAVVQARDGREYHYTRPGRTGSQAMGAGGAFLQGLMGAGLPEVTTTQLVLRGKLPPRIAVATSVTTLTVTVFFAALIHAIGGEPPWHVVVWSMPGALTGAQFGARLQAKLPPNVSQRFLAVVFLAVGILVIALRDAG
ncbi:MAG: sulfite exporter TauE/SafE family protein [Chloroflexi bacterium]|nr:sulfite exporter TauE/SafE family protein [Chloroflexota bacterium]